jgi:LCP family protein required for cell wall assembly
VRLLPSSRGGALWRFALASLLVIGFVATTTAVAGLLQFKQFVSDLAINPSIKGVQVTTANPGNPQTLLLIGSDHRAGEPFADANTDTMMLVRMNPNSSTINLLSIPRDLEVQIPEAGGMTTDKLNAAYSIGGDALLLKVIKANVFPHLVVNHILDVNFGGFIDLVNAIGCVYTDVDHRYYNNTALTDYSSIDLQPGYQKLCGSDALSFVRFRHTDSDIVRNARQQDFLRWAKDQYSLSQLISNRNTLVKLFGEHVQTDADLHSLDGLLNLFNLVIFSDGHELKNIPFPAILNTCPPPNPDGSQPPCYVNANPGPLAAAYRGFMSVTGAPAGRNDQGVPGTGGGGAPSAPNLTTDVSDAQAQATALKYAGLPVYVPKLIDSGASYCLDANGNCPVEIASPGSYPRAYLIHGRDGTAYHAYRITAEINPSDGEYYGIQGMTWQHPPLIGTPTVTKYVNGKQLLLYANGGRISVVAWRTPYGLYWVSNTLNDLLSNKQMVAIAASFTHYY